MIQHFYNKHWHAVTGSYHGDMAHAFKAMLADMDFAGYFRDVQKVTRAIQIHIGLERDPQYKGRKWFTETFAA